MEVIDLFQLSLLDAEKIKGEVIESVSQWQKVAPKWVLVVMSKR